MSEASSTPLGKDPVLWAYMLRTRMRANRRWRRGQRRRALKEENLRLRLALTRISVEDPPSDVWDQPPSVALEWAGKIAREALAS